MPQTPREGKEGDHFESRSLSNYRVMRGRRILGNINHYSASAAGSGLRSAACKHSECELNCGSVEKKMSSGVSIVEIRLKCVKSSLWTFFFHFPSLFFFSEMPSPSSHRLSYKSCWRQQGEVEEIGWDVVWWTSLLPRPAVGIWIIVERVDHVLMVVHLNL